MSPTPTMVIGCRFCRETWRGTYPRLSHENCPSCGQGPIYDPPPDQESPKAGTTSASPGKTSRQRWANGLFIAGIICFIPPILFCGGVVVGLGLWFVADMLEDGSTPLSTSRDTHADNSLIAMRQALAEDRASRR